MLSRERTLPVVLQVIEVAVVSNREARHEPAGWSEARGSQMIDRLQQFAWFLWLFVPPDMLQGRDADNQIVFVLRDKLDDILIDDA